MSEASLCGVAAETTPGWVIEQLIPFRFLSVVSLQGFCFLHIISSSTDQNNAWSLGLEKKPFFKPCDSFECVELR